MNNVKKSIGWADFTLNPVKGLCPVACSYCYARRIYQRNCNATFKDKSIRYEPDVMKDIEQSKPGDRIFVGSTIDLFHPEVSRWTQEIIDTCGWWLTRTFIFLTKCPQYLKDFTFPDNCWVGVSVCNNKMLDVAVDKLEDLSIPGIKFISFEPLLKHITLSLDYTFYYSGISWIIIGAQTPFSKKTAPRIEWVQEILVAAHNADNIPVYMKNNLQPLIDSIPGWSGWELRHEFPKGR